MDDEELDKLCDELRALTSEPPGTSPHLLNRARAISLQFQRAAPSDPYVKEKSQDVVAEFEIWFSARR
jgi:hypothetical protein